MGLEKWAPQGSMFVPLVYNLYSNDLLYLVCDLYNIYNYADDNAICIHGNNIGNVLLNIVWLCVKCFNELVQGKFASG